MANSIVQAGNNQSSESPFDQIRHVDDRGMEFWFARELMPLLDYDRWDRVPDVIDRAIAACENAGNSSVEHFSESPRKTKGRPQQDFRLSRYACYLTAMNGDPRKSGVAAAQSYFASKTREAELTVAPVAIALPPTDIRIVNLHNALSGLGIDAQNPRYKQYIQDVVLDQILGATLPASTERWAGVAEIAEEMGYSSTLVAKNRAMLGKFVASCGLTKTQEKRLCNGTFRPINLYLDCQELRDAISEFMDAKVLATAAE